MLQTMPPDRVITRVKCKRAALCRHVVLSSDRHVLCFRCKLLGNNVAQFCSFDNRCVECIHMCMYEMLLSAIVTDLFVAGIDVLHWPTVGVGGELYVGTLFQLWISQRDPEHLPSRQRPE